ncbi:unnamed protein product, partial [Staurois parvus]
RSLWVVSIATLCHVPLSGLLTHCCCVEFFDIGCWQITASHSCCQLAPNLPWAPIYRLLMLLPSPESLMGPVRPPIAAVSIATLCHVPLSGLLTHCWCPESVMGPCTASIAAVSIATLCHVPLSGLL